MAELIKKILVCYDYIPHHQDYYLDFDPYVYGWTATYINGPLPTGIEAIYNDIDGSVIGFSVYDTLGVGEFNIDLVVFDTNNEVYGYFIYQIVRGSCISEKQICCNDDAMTIRWLGFNGAIRQWTFNGVREYEIKVGDANTFKTVDKISKYSERKNIYSLIKLTSGSISRDDVDYLSELRGSIQAWLVSDESLLPILLTNDSFPLYKSKQKYYDVSISFIMAAETIVQTQ